MRTAVVVFGVVAGGLLAAAVFYLVLDRVSGFRFSRTSLRVMQTREAISSRLWLFIAALFILGLVVRNFPSDTQNRACHVARELDGSEVVC